MNMERYYAKIFELCEQFRPEHAPIANAAPPGQKVSAWRRSELVWIMSLRNEERDSYAGMCLAAPNAFVAAELVFGGTYRLATPEEIAVEEERQRVERERILAQDAASRSQGTTVQVPADALRESIAKLGIQLAKSTGK